MQAHDYAFKASNTIDKLRILEMKKKKKNQHKNEKCDRKRREDRNLACGRF